MGAGDDAGFAVGEQHRAAVGNGYADGKRGSLADNGIGTRRVLARPRFVGDHRVGGMNLVAAHEVGRVQRFRHCGGDSP